MVIKRKRRNKQKQLEQIQDKKQEQPEIKGEVESEDYCFVCKDGGLLMVCDHKECHKAYHPACVGQEESTEDTAEPWICEWHRCLVCKRNSRYQCYCCPNAVCQSQNCLKDATFARVSGSKGFCDNCLKLALLGEEGFEVDSDGEKVDFKDRETYEGLFKEYWDIIKEKEGLILEDLHRADVQIKKGEDSRQLRKLRQSQKPHFDSDESVKEEENKEVSDDDHDSDHESDDNVAVQPVIVEKKKPKRAPKKKKGPKKIEFLGWASKPLIEFLASIGVDTSKKLTQDDVALTINKYVHENKLLHPEKKKLIVCDERLRSLSGRRTVSVYKVNDLLEPHFFENLNQSDDEGYSSGYEEDNTSMPAKKQAWWRKGEGESFQHKGSLMKKFQQKECVLDEPNKEDVGFSVIYSEFATIDPQNMKLVYLKKALVEKLLEEFETFESKLVGSFVKVKSDPFDPKHPYQLLPVTGIETSGNENNKKVLLQVSNMPNDVPISKLSNDDISKEDCVELCEKVENGLLPKPTVVELEKKAKELHEDITKFWINRELAVLRNRIDMANEKGWRAELYEYRKRRELLLSEEEQTRLLNEIPKIIADAIEVKPASEDTQPNDGPDNVSTPREKLKGNGTMPV